MTQQDNFIYLTFALVLLLLATALAQQFFDHSMQHIVQSSTVITLLVAVWGVNSQKFFLRSALIFPIGIISVAIVTNWLDKSGFDFLHLFFLLAFFISTAQKTAKQVLFTGGVDGNKILGAICLYLLMGLIWAIIYTLIQLSFPGAFQNIGNSDEWFTLLPNFIYFSFVTLTTLGFGDLLPIEPVARFLVYFEAIVGQFYLAILVASLVGSRMSHITEAEDNKSSKHKT